MRERLSELRVEIASDVADAAGLPWELLRDPRLARPLALEAASFVRVNVRPAQRVRVAGGVAETLRVYGMLMR